MKRIPIPRFTTARRLYSSNNKAGPSKSYLRATHPTPPSSSISGSGHLSPSTAALLDKANTYLLPVYARPDFVLERGKGSWVWDVDGRRYLDFSAGIAVNAFGHGDEGVCEVISKQAAKLLHTSNVYHNEWSGKLGELLVTLTQKEGGLGYAPGSQVENTTTTMDTPKVFFSNSGTEANEGALKVARKVGKERWASAVPGRSATDTDACGKTRIVCFENGFHGRSMGALSVTTNPKYQKPFAPLLPGVDVGRVNDFMEGEGGLEALIGEDTCAVIVEPIQGEGGIFVVGEEWLRRVRKRCDEVGAVLIYDEIQCGLYRSGTLWAHSSLPVDCHPDIVTMAKPLANGYPIGAVLLRGDIAATMTAGTHGTTFGGSPLACAVGYHVLSRLSLEETKVQVEETSGYLRGRLSLLPRWFPELLEERIRGRGLILGLGFKDGSVPGKVVGLARERGVFVLTAGKDAIRLVPSLNVAKGEVDFAVDVLESCLSLV